MPPALRPLDPTVRMARARHRAAQVDQVVLRVHLDHLQVLDRDPLAAHAPAGPHARKDARREGRRADRARCAVKHPAVRGTAAGEAVAFDDTLEALALARRDHVGVLLLLDYGGLARAAPPV